MGFKDEGINPEPWARAQLELLALARQQPAGRNDPDAARAVAAGMEYPKFHYLAAAGWLIAQLASRLGPIDEVLNEMVRDIAGGAADW